MVFEISKVYREGDEVDLHVPGTNLERFRVRVSDLTFVERTPAPQSSDPFTEAEPIFEILVRLDNVQIEVLERLDSDIAVFKAYLKTQHAPAVAIGSLETLIVEQHVSWKKTVERIKKILDR